MQLNATFARLLGLTLASVLGAGAVLAQTTTPPATTPPATGGGTTTPTPTRPPTTSPTQPSTTNIDRSSTSTMNDVPRPIFLSGRVVMEDGTSPPESVVIERVCNGVARPESHTDSRGNFSFQLGANTNTFSDASVSSASDMPFGGGGSRAMGVSGSREFTERQMNNCEIRASLPGHRSVSVPLVGRRSMDDPNLGTIVLYRMGKVEGYTVSATMALAPKDARKAFEKGQDALKKKKVDDAVREFDKAVTLYPKHAAAWHMLGTIRENRKDVAGAREAYAKSIEADSRYVGPYERLAQMAAAEGKWNDAAESSGRLLKLNPYDYPHMYFVNAVANFNIRKLDEAEESAKNAIKFDPRHQMPRVHHLLGLILAQKQQYAKAVTEIRNYLQYAPNANDAAQVRKQLADFEKAAQAQ